MSNNRNPIPPPHLRKETRKWWREIVVLYAFERQHLLLLTAAGESWDRCQAARELLEAEGLTVADRFGQMKPHPAATIERDARAGFVRCLTALGLDVDPPTHGKRRR